MATELIGIGGAGAALQLTQFDKRLLTRFRASTCFMQYGMKRSIPRHGGKAIQFRKYESIYAAGNAGSAAAGSAPTALTEGTYPAEIQATITTVAATVSQYGQYLKYSDVLDAQGIDNFVAEQTDNFAEAMKDAMDLLTRDVLVAGTNVQYAGVAGSRGGTGSGHLLTLAELREAKRTLKNNNVPPMVDGKYLVITNPNAMFDLEGDSNITNIWQYAGARGLDSNQLFDATFKDLPMGFRLCETTNTRVFVDSGLSAADVVATLVLGREAYGVVDYDALPARVISHRPGTSGIADPLDQIGTLGWKASHAAVRLQEAAIVRIEHITSANTMG
jgi:N4-gp56 family major capsid protein